MTGALQEPDRRPTSHVGGSWLDGAPPALELPADRPRPTALGGQTAHHELELSPLAVARLMALVERSSTDVQTVLLAAFGVLVMRTTDEQDVVVGCGGPDGSRGDRVLVVRWSVTPDQSLLEVVGRAAAALAESAARGARTVADWVRELGLEPAGGRHPVFQVGFWSTPGPVEGTWPGSWSTPPDLSLAYWRRGEALVLGVDWPAELFDHRRIERFTAHLVQLLEAGAQDDARPVGLLPLLTEEEVAELTAWNSTASPAGPLRPLAARFWEQVEATPDAPAVEHDGRAVTYRELSQRATRVARALRAHGVDSDVPVAVCAERSLDMLAGVLGTLMAGGAYVPVDPAYPASRREFMIVDSGARVVLTQSRLSDVVPAQSHAEVVFLDALPDVDGGPDGAELRGRSTQDLGYVIYTSGSTGQPKGVAMPQSALDNLVTWQLHRPQFVPGARVLQFSALSFDVSFQEMFTTWASGGTLVLVDEATRRDPLRLLQHLVEHRIERLFLPYVALRGLASAVGASGRWPTSLREVYTAGEQLQVDPVLRALFDGLPGTVLENQYGPSESHVVTAHTLDADVTRWPALPPVGRPVANSQVHVLDSRGQQRPVGVPGELHLGGACLARGYLGRPDLTQDRFVPAPAWAGGGTLYRTGDLARWLPSGDVEFLGRLDHQVKFRGYRIEPGEVGAVLSACPGIEQSVAVVRVVEGGSRLIVYLVPAAGHAPDLGDVHRWAKAHLPAYMVPSHYVVLPALPLTSSGKIDTASLPDAAFDRSILSSQYQAPSSHEEQVLADIWSTLLALPEVGVLDDFFELGGDSLLAAEMVQRVSEELGREMPLGALAQAPTIGALAALLRADDDRALWGSLVPLQPGSAATTPLFVVHGGSGNVASFPRLARALPPEQPVYALQWDGVGRGRGQRTVERMAEHYLREVREVQESGPYLLAGQCIGGLVAREMSRQLMDQGEAVALLVMYDSPNLGSDHYVPASAPPLHQRLTTPRGLRATAYGAARWVYLRTLKRDRVVRGRLAMRRAAWRHRVTPLPGPVPTHFVGSGESDASRIGLAGHWTDGAMGWASSESAQFFLHRVDADHNDLLYDPAAVDLLTKELQRAHVRLAQAPPVSTG